MIPAPLAAAPTSRTGTITLREFQPGDEAAFRRLNELWIGRLFTLEPTDLFALSNPQTAYLEGGGRIFFLVADGEDLIGCCALLPMRPGEFEVSKMTVLDSWRGHGLGRRILQHVIAQARTAGATRLYLETNHTLFDAIHLYESVGFRHLPPERITPSPYARADVYMELLLPNPQQP